MGPEDRLHSLAHGPGTPGAPGHPVGDAPHLGRRIGGSEGQPCGGQERQIWKIVSHVGHFGGGETEPGEKLGEELHFVHDILVDFPDPQVGHPAGDSRRGTPGEDHHPKPGSLGSHQGEAIPDVEDLPVLPARAVVKSPVGEDPVNVEKQEPDGPRSTPKRAVRSRGTVGGHTILARRISCRWMIPMGRRRGSTTISWVMA